MSVASGWRRYLWRVLASLAALACFALAYPLPDTRRAWLLLAIAALIWCVRIDQATRDRAREGDR